VDLKRVRGELKKTDEELTSADAKERSMWERLGTKAVNEIVFFRPKGRVTGSSTTTTGFAHPDRVVNWKFKVKRTFDKLTKEKLKLPCMDIFHVYDQGEATMRHYLLSPLTILVEECCNELRREISIDIGKVVTVSEQYMNSGLRVDSALVIEGKGAFIYIEAKSSMSYPKEFRSGYVHDPVNMA